MPNKKELEVTIFCPKCGEGREVVASCVAETIKCQSKSSLRCEVCNKISPFSQWCPENISIPGAEGQESKPNQRDRILDILLHGVWLDRFETIRDCVSWELSARIIEIEREWKIKLIRNWIIRGGLRCRCYRLRWVDIDNIQDTLKNMRHNKNMENKLENT